MQPQYSSWPAEPIDYTTSPRLTATSSTYPSSYGDSQMLQHSSESSLSTSPGNAHYLTYPYPQPQRTEDLTEGTYAASYTAQSSSTMHPLQPRYPLDARSHSPPVSVFLQSSTTASSSSRVLLSPPPSTDSPSSIASAPTGITEMARPPSRGSKLQSIHDRVTAPYDYTEGYHFLMKHLPTRCVY